MEFSYLHYIWTNRLKWIKRKKDFKSCLFCDFISGKVKYRYVLFKGKNIWIIMNKFPYNTGHLMVLPVKHVESLEELNNNEIKELFVAVKESMKILKKALNPLGFNIGINIGEEAGASIKHLHVHIVPRFKRDVGFMEVISSTKIMPEPLEKTFKKLRKHFKKFNLWS